MIEDYRRPRDPLIDRSKDLDPSKGIAIGLAIATVLWGFIIYGIYQWGIRGTESAIARVCPDVRNGIVEEYLLYTKLNSLPPPELVTDRWQRLSSFCANYDGKGGAQ
jgi:hypothetical protein